MKETLRELRKQLLHQTEGTTNFLGERCSYSTVVEKILELELQSNHVELKATPEQVSLTLIGQLKKDYKQDCPIVVNLEEIPLDEIYDFAHNLDEWVILTEDDLSAKDFLLALQEELSNEKHGCHFLEWVGGEYPTVHLTFADPEQIILPWEIFMRIVARRD